MSKTEQTLTDTMIFTVCDIACVLSDFQLKAENPQILDFLTRADTDGFPRSYTMADRGNMKAILREQFPALDAVHFDDEGFKQIATHEEEKCAMRDVFIAKVETALGANEVEINRPSISQVYRSYKPVPSGNPFDGPSIFA